MSSFKNFGLDDVELPFRDEYPIYQSIKYNGPPGVGKSWKQIKRLALNKEEKDLDDDEICAVTYRKSLARDFAGRLYQEGVTETENPKYIGTLHSVCLGLIGGLPNDVGFVEYEDKQEFSEKYLNIPYYGEDPGDPDPGKKLLEYFAWCNKNNTKIVEGTYSTKYEEVEEAFSNLRILRMEGFHEKWVEYKKQNKIVEHYEVLKKVVDDGLVPDVEVLVIDELHDAYPLYFSVISMWLNELKGDAVRIVSGDPYQVVNQHEGADPSFFRQVDIKEVTLPESYRVPEQHWNYAQSIISKEYSPVETEPVSADGSIRQIEVAPMQSDYGDWTIPSGSSNPANIVEDRLVTDGEPIDSMLILARTRNQLNGVGKALEDAGIPYDGPNSNWYAPQYQAYETGHLYDLYTGLAKLLPAVRQQSELTTSVTDNSTVYTEFDEECDVILERNEIVRLINHTPEKYINGEKKQAMKNVKYLPKDTLEGFAEFVRKQFFEDIQNLGNFEFVNLNDEEEHMIYKALSKKDYAIPPIKLRTIHGSKGLEAESVLLYDGITSRIRESIQTNVDARLNECRVWYVGATRSSKSLTIIRNGFNYTKTSPYLPQLKESNFKQADSQTVQNQIEQ